MGNRDHNRATPVNKKSNEVAEDRSIGSVELTRWKTPLGRFIAHRIQWISDRLGPHATLILTLALGALVAAGFTYLSAEVYEAVTDVNGVAALDHPALEAAESIRSPGLDLFATAYTDVAGVIIMPIIAVTALAVLSLKRRSWTPTILIIAAAAGSLLMTIAGKQLIGRTRPPLSDAVPPFEYSASFPSGHTLNATVIAGIIAYLLILRRHSIQARVLTVAAAATFAVTIGLSRIYLGHHWLTDVLVAITLGLAWLVTVITAHRLFLTVLSGRPRATSRTR